MKTYLAIALLVNITLYAQQFVCGVSNEPLQVELRRRELLDLIKQSHRKAATEISYVPVKAHLYGRDDSTGYENQTALNNELAKLNAAFKPSKIEFYFSGSSFNYYPDSSFYYGQATGQAQDDFHTANGATNAVNVYFSQNINYYGAVGAGLAFVGVTGQVMNRIWLQNNSSGTTHEFGHYFTLYHTFNNSTSSFIETRELVTRNFAALLPLLSANCHDAGDFVCDTQSDPLYNGDAMVSNCIYSGTVTDANNDLFHPDLNNFMDYYNCNPDIFTTGQYERLKDGFTLAANPNNNFTLDAPETIQNAPTNLQAVLPDPDYNYITLSWTDNSTSETGYIIEKSVAAAGPFTAIAGVQADVVSYSYLSAEAGNSNYFRIKASNSKANYSNISNMVSVSHLCGNENGQSCELNTDPTDAAYRIESFKLSRGSEVLINNINSGCSVNGLGNYYNSFQANIAGQQILDFNVKSKTGDLSSVYYVIVKLYADWNRDNDFLDNGELLYTSSVSMPAEDSGSFIVPSNVTNGNVRLRVILTAGTAINSPCSVAFGEMEDYKLSIDSLAMQQYSVDASVLLYPNPSHDYFTINAAGRTLIDKIIVKDLTGKVVKELITDFSPVSVEDLAQGIYLVEVYTDGRKDINKFIKN